MPNGALARSRLLPEVFKGAHDEACLSRSDAQQAIRDHYARIAVMVVPGIVMLLVERFRPVPDVREADRTPVVRALGIGIAWPVALGSIALFLANRRLARTDLVA